MSGVVACLILKSLQGALAPGASAALHFAHGAAFNHLLGRGKGERCDGLIVRGQRPGLFTFCYLFRACTVQLEYRGLPASASRAR